MKKFDFLPVAMWASEDRPDNRLESLGVRGLTTSELLSVVIGLGDYENAVEVSKKFLSSHENSLLNISRKDVKDLCKCEGIGVSKARRVLAALELGRRMSSEASIPVTMIKSADIVYRLMHPEIGRLEEEEFWILLLNQNYRLIKKKRVSHGGLTSTLVDVRILMRDALLNNSTVIAVCHNHPSGNKRPSKDDDNLTNSIKKACDVMRIHFLDHVVIVDGDYYSYRETGRL